MEDIKYHKEHTWVEIEGEKAIVGITNYAQESLGDIVHIDLPEVEEEVEANTELAEIVSTKATLSIISPVSGKIIEVNEELRETPEIINEDPHGMGWIAVIKIDNTTELSDLMDVSDYERYLEKKIKLR